MEFCEKCGALMLPRKEEGKKTITLKTVRSPPEYKVEHRIKHTPREKIIVVEEETKRSDEMTEDERRERRKEILEYYESEDD
jgi:DNA-directed RNA polymerase subunit M/transcription elongation factor TFIIS